MPTLTRPAAAFLVYHARRAGTPTGPAAYGPWRDLGLFVPLEVIERLAPDVHRAKVEFDIARAGTMPWAWDRYFAMDDRIAIVDDNPDRARRQCVFHGFIQDVDMAFGTGGHVIVTACSNAMRLKADTVVWGRMMWLPDATNVAHFTGLPCVFNAGGKPNRSPDSQNFYPGIDVPAFSYDDDPAAASWTLADIVQYVQWRWNNYDPAACGNVWVLNADVSGADAPVAEVNCEGMSSWDAMAEAAAKAGYDLFERVENDGAGWPYSQAVLVKKHSGTVRTVMHAPLAGDGGLGAMDLRTTNLFAASIADSSASCVVRPIAAGGAYLAEITIELGKAWKYWQISAIDGPVWHTNETQTARAKTWWKRFCTDGEEFHLYADAGRLWDANTDGRYSAAPYSLAVPDVASLADFLLPLPKMPFKPLPMLTRLSDLPGGPSGDILAEITLDGGTTWFLLKNFQALPDRLGLRITEKNLTGIIQPGAATSNFTQQNLFQVLLDHPDLVRVRMTCTVELPYRAWHQPARRPAQAGTALPTVGFFDRKARGQIRYRAKSSRFAGSALPADESALKDVTGDHPVILDAVAIQAAVDGKSVEANLAIEWPDEPLYLTDCISKIKGIEYDLASNAGSARIYPRIVARTLLLTPETHSMSIVLDTDRKAGIV